ncbi:anti-sigma factor family protein [Microvirga zambiensis]|uniref:anti-sigma factor family protein n=1 Tax=Microvirga zambiensis TaxID=1402137 RepID=UPI00191CB8D0|nr:hypothetical protein [Microvirga zambiensis]
MSELHLTDEILMAFADGELDEPVAAAVAKAMVDDPGIARRIVDFQQSRRLMRSAFSGALMPEVPPALHAAVSAQIEAYEAKQPRAVVTDIGKVRDTRRWGALSFPPMALAASLAVVAAGIGYWTGSYASKRTDTLMARLEDPAVHRELSRVASGNEVDLPFGRLRVISSYRLEDGVLCREFKLTQTAEAADAVACRRDGWNVTFALTGETAGSGYVPSDGGGDAMTAYLQSVGAGEPLVDEAETKAMMDIAR